MIIYDYRQRVKEEKLSRLPKDVQFLHKCPNFLNDKCASINWNKDSPCWDCVKQNKYIIRRKERE